MLSAGASPNGAAIADFNGDHKNDLAVANHDGHSITVFLNQGAFAYVLGKAGEIDSARAVIARIEARGAARWNDYISMAVAALSIPDTAKALDALEKGFARNESVTAWWPFWAHIFDPIRESGRFKAMARKAGIAF